MLYQRSPTRCRRIMLMPSIESKCHTWWILVHLGSNLIPKWFNMIMLQLNARLLCNYTFHHLVALVSTSTTAWWHHSLLCRWWRALGAGDRTWAWTRSVSMISVYHDGSNSFFRKEDSSQSVELSPTFVKISRDALLIISKCGLSSDVVMGLATIEWCSCWHVIRWKYNWKRICSEYKHCQKVCFCNSTQFQISNL